MEVNVEKQGTSLAKVSLNVPETEYQSEVRRGLNSARQSIRMKGFRPGKAPMKLVEREFGERVRMEVQQNFISRAYQQAVETESLKPMSHPRINPEDVSIEDGKLVLEFDISLRPEIDLGEYKGMKIESELEPLMVAEVDSAIADVRRNQSQPEPAGDDGIDEEGFVVCDIAFLHEEDEVMSRDGLRLSPMTPPPGADPEVFKEALIGANVDDVIELEAVIPDTVDKEESRGQTGSCRLSIKEAFNLVPPTDEDLYKLLDVDNEDDFLKQVREKLTEAKEQRENGRIETVLLDRLIANADFDVPEPLLAEQTEGRLKQLHGELEKQELDHDKIHEAMDEQRPTARAEAEKSLKALLLVETIGEKEELLVTQEEMDAELASIAERNQATVDEVRKYYAENNMGQQMAIEVLERKVRKFLRESAEVTKPS